MMNASTCGRWAFSATNFLLASHHSKRKRRTSLTVVFAGNFIAQFFLNLYLMPWNIFENFRVDLRFPAHVSAGARDLIAKLLKYRAEDRLPLKKIMEHEWVVQHLTSEVRSK
jgi:hypothetical protein